MGFEIVFIFTPEQWGNDPIRRAYVSHGLVQPPTSLFIQFVENCLPPHPEKGPFQKTMNHLPSINFGGWVLSNDFLHLFTHRKNWGGNDPLWYLSYGNLPSKKLGRLWGLLMRKYWEQDSESEWICWKWVVIPNKIPLIRPRETQVLMLLWYSDILLRYFMKGT